MDTAFHPSHVHPIGETFQAIRGVRDKPPTRFIDRKQPEVKVSERRASLVIRYDPHDMGTGFNLDQQTARAWRFRCLPTYRRDARARESRLRTRSARLMSGLNLVMITIRKSFRWLINNINHPGPQIGKRFHRDVLYSWINR